MTATAALALGALVGCSSGSDQGPISDEEFRDQMRVGDFASYSDTQLESVAKGLCSDMEGMEEDMRHYAVLVIRESTTTEAEAFQVGQAITGRWCPEYSAAFDY